MQSCLCRFVGSHVLRLITFLSSFIGIIECFPYLRIVSYTEDHYNLILGIFILLLVRAIWQWHGTIVIEITIFSINSFNEYAIYTLSLQRNAVYTLNLQRIQLVPFVNYMEIYFIILIGLFPRRRGQKHMLFSTSVVFIIWEVESNVSISFTIIKCYEMLYYCIIS